ncbi:hypothetical protein BCR43DRAFT_483183 [Syncephalastrum racemosum]|uniref:Methylmalonic aciduria and homocystinuria type D protein n=1 Tax=Syncephalastrum racemosum TaxID=13706 RepID=A0A1X2HV35_SYNRA|nr:hypothetical protein BCR43DRAFT_483183 [Syncephalastrum racemosum]
MPIPEPATSPDRLGSTKDSSTAGKKSKKVTSCPISPTRCQYGGSTFEYAAFSPSTRFLKEVQAVFPRLSRQQLNTVLIVPVFQQCENDMVGITPEINRERDVKLELFIEWGNKVADRLAQVGMWGDMTDPASGYPVRSEPGPSTYPDVQATHSLMPSMVDVQNVGCCHILLHRDWKSHVYPATFFTTAPADILQKIIAEIINNDSSHA